MPTNSEHISKWNAGERSPQRAIARELKAGGLTYAQIGERLGVSRQRAQQLVSPTPASRKKLVASVGNKCARCGATGKLDLHHASYDPNDNTPAEVLCPSCHRDAHSSDGPKSSGEVSPKLASKITAALQDKADRANATPEEMVITSLYLLRSLKDKAVAISQERRRSFNNYVTALIERDVTAYDRRRKATAQPEPTEA